MPYLTEWELPGAASGGSFKGWTPGEGFGRSIQFGYGAPNDGASWFGTGGTSARLADEEASGPAVVMPPWYTNTPRYDPTDVQLTPTPYDHNPFLTQDPSQGLTPPPAVQLGGDPKYPPLPITTDPGVIGAIDPKTGLPIRHAPPPVQPDPDDVHPDDPMGPNNPTVYGNDPLTVFNHGGLLGTGFDIGLPRIISLGGVIQATGLGGLVGMDTPGQGLGGPLGLDTGGQGGIFGLGNGGGLLGLGGGDTILPPRPGPILGPTKGGGAAAAANNPPNQTPPPLIIPPIFGSSTNTPTRPPQAPELNPPTVTVPPIFPGTGPTVDNPPANTLPIVPLGPGVQTPPTTPPVETPPPVVIPPIIPPSTPPVTPPPPTSGPPATPPAQTTTMPLPLDRNYYREGNQTNQDNSALLPGIFQNYQNYSGGYGQTDQANFSALLGALGIDNSALTGIANQQTAAGNTALRTGNVADAGNLGGQALGLLQQLNPNMYGALNRTNTTAGATGSPSDIQMMLEQQAREGLALGTGLSAEDRRNAQQSAREAWSARGLVNSPGAVGDEILNRDALGRQRLAERQALASAVDQQGFSQRQQGFGNQIQNSLLQMQGAFNPFETITSANTMNQGSNQQLFSQGAGFSSGAFGNQNVNSLVNPFNPYSQDVYNSNFNAANARYISAGNNAAAMSGARDAATGDIANSFLKLIGSIYGAS